MTSPDLAKESVTLYIGPGHLRLVSRANGVGGTVRSRAKTDNGP